MNHLQRMEACISGGRVDRPPVALWRHFPVDDQSPGHLAQAVVRFQQHYDFDLVKVTPASSFCVKDWGVQDEWRGSTEGTREYTRWAIQQPEDWLKLHVLDPYQGRLGDQLECLKLIVKELGVQVPVIQTIFNPLSQAKYLIGRDLLLIHLRRFPDALQRGLEIITETTRRFVEAAKATGIAGIFFAVQHAQYSLLTDREYIEFGRRYDLQVLEAARDLWLNMLHLHGEHVMFNLVSDYPVAVLNWHDQDTPPSLEEGKRIFPGAVCGGLQREETMLLGTPDQVKAEAMAAIRSTNGERFILGTGCVIPITTPSANLIAARQSVENGTS